MNNGICRPETAIHVGIVGSPDFCRRMTAIVHSRGLAAESCTASFAEAWSVILSRRPNALLIEIGIHHTDRLHAWLRQMLQQLRERCGADLYVVAALLSSGHLGYGGDLLFEEGSLRPSRLIDTFIALPPATMPSIPQLPEQVGNALTLYRHERARRADGKQPLPPLGAEGWVQSLADPESRELWMRWIPRYAGYTNENPIIIGETGTGKTNMAYALHLLAGRTGKFVSITPRDFSSSELIQGELFGAVEGAYTGAVDKWGLVKSAEKGTLFIDELQSIDKALQGKLITFIENKIYRRVGSAESIEADVRFVFASNESLFELMESDVLRHDFAYRLERVRLELPPLRSRRLDITAGLAYALAKIHRQRAHTRNIFGINTNAYRMLFSHQWPGNLRQLENTTAKLCEIADMKGTQSIDEEAVSRVFESRLSGKAATSAEVVSQAASELARLALRSNVASLQDSVEHFARLVRMCALEAAGGDLGSASAMIGDHRRLMTFVAQDIIAAQETKGGR